MRRVIVGGCRTEWVGDVRLLVLGGISGWGGGFRSGKGKGWDEWV